MIGMMYQMTPLDFSFSHLLTDCMISFLSTLPAPINSRRLGQHIRWSRNNTQKHQSLMAQLLFWAIQELLNSEVSSQRFAALFGP
jgi:hypothetical protein